MAPTAGIRDLRETIAQMHRRAFDYGAFAKRAAAGVDPGPEPLPIALKAVEALEAQIASVLEPRGIPFRRYSEFREVFKSNHPHPGGGLWGETPESMAWNYNALFQWLDELQVVVGALPTSDGVPG